MVIVAGATRVETDPLKIESATHLILSGVGSFDEGVEAIQTCGLKNLIGKEGGPFPLPMLGICLGMQLLGLKSEEGNRTGLGLIASSSVGLAKLGVPSIPSVGWSRLKILKDDPILFDVPSDARFYFSHSYGMVAVPPENLIATPKDHPSFAAIIRKNNCWGVQFHPEKSLRYGLKILKNFLCYSPKT